MCAKALNVYSVSQKILNLDNGANFRSVNWLRLVAHICVIELELRWRHNERCGVSNHRRLHRLLNRLSRRRSQKISKLRVTGLGEGNSPVTGEFPTPVASNAENASIWCRHHGSLLVQIMVCHLLNAKPLPGSIQANCWLDAYQT